MNNKEKRLNKDLLSDIEKLKEENADLYNWQGRVLNYLGVKDKDITAAKAIELIAQLKYDLEYYQQQYYNNN